MTNLLVVALIALAVPAIFLVDSISQWMMRLVLTEAGRRPATVAEYNKMVSAVEGKSKSKGKPELKHVHAA